MEVANFTAKSSTILLTQKNILFHWFSEFYCFLADFKKRFVQVFTELNWTLTFNEKFNKKRPGSNFLYKCHSAMKTGSASGFYLFIFAWRRKGRLFRWVINWGEEEFKPITYLYTFWRMTKQRLFPHCPAARERHTSTFPRSVCRISW